MKGIYHYVKFLPPFCHLNKVHTKRNLALVIKIREKDTIVMLILNGIKNRSKLILLKSKHS